MDSHSDFGQVLLFKIHVSTQGGSGSIETPLRIHQSPQLFCKNFALTIEEVLGSLKYHQIWQKVRRKGRKSSMPKYLLGWCSSHYLSFGFRVVSDSLLFSYYFAQLLQYTLLPQYKYCTLVWGGRSILMSENFFSQQNLLMKIPKCDFVSNKFKRIKLYSLLLSKGTVVFVTTILDSLTMYALFLKKVSWECKRSLLFLWSLLSLESQINDEHA